MKNIVYISGIFLLLTACGGGTPYYTYRQIAEEHNRLFSAFAQSSNIGRYQEQLKTNKLGGADTSPASHTLDSLEKEFRQRFFHEMKTINKKSGNRQKGNEIYRTRRALEVLSEQHKGYSSIPDTIKKNLTGFILGKNAVWIREIDLPFSDYDHVSSPYKNKSLVLYYFDSFDPETGFGIYYQTNAFYLRDAYDLSLDDIKNHRRVEYFCAPFFVQNTSDGMQLHLLSPANELIERKVFRLETFRNKTGPDTLTRQKMAGSHIFAYELFKKYEYKADNDFPFNLGSYKLYWCQDYDTFRKEEKDRLRRIYDRTSDTSRKEKDRLRRTYDRASDTSQKKQLNEFNELSTDALNNMDFMYPVKADNTGQQAEQGWVYFGRIYIDTKHYGTGMYYDSATHRMNQLKQELGKPLSPDSLNMQHLEKLGIKDETFYKKSPFISRHLYYFNNETENLWRLLHRHRNIQPLEIIYLRNSPGKQNNITGEADPFKIYEIEAMQLIGDFLWLKVKDVGHEKNCPDCKFNCKRRYWLCRKNKGKQKKFRKKCQGTCTCHTTPIGRKKKFRPERDKKEIQPVNTP